jgi:hypothetical protein
MPIAVAITAAVKATRSERRLDMGAGAWANGEGVVFGDPLHREA